jgi:hypothetical protein
MSSMSSEELLSLVETGDFDGLLRVVTLEELAAAWHRFRREPQDASTSDHPDEWASRLWYSAVWYDECNPVQAAVVEIIEQANSDQELGFIGASILENCVSGQESSLRWIEEQARASVKFRRALRDVWVYDFLDPVAFARIELAAGVPLANPRRADR